MLQSWNEQAQKERATRKPSPPRRKAPDLRVARYYNKKWPYLCWAVARPIVAQLGWLAGDRLDILYDPITGQGLLKRVNKGGWGMSMLPSRGAATFRMAFRPWMCLDDMKFPVVAHDVKVTADGLAFRLPG